MISGNDKLLHWMVLLLATIPATLWCAEPDTEALIRSLAKTPPASVAFTEVRFSPLLRRPLIVSGTLVYASSTRLDRQVRSPYIEDTEIRGESVRVTRAGESPRSFALQRAPELRGLLTGLTALLAGDVAAIERSFRVTHGGDQQAWTLELTPSDARTRRRLKRIKAYGHEATPHCFSVQSADRGASFILLEATADIALSADVTFAAVEQHCIKGRE